MKRLNLLLLVVFISVLCGCEKDYSTPEEFILDNPDYTDQLILTSQYDLFYFKVYKTDISDEKYYLYEYTVNEDYNVGQVTFHCVIDGNHGDSLLLIDLHESNDKVDFLPKFRCSGELSIWVYRHEQEGAFKVGVLEE